MGNSSVTAEGRRRSRRGRVAAAVVAGGLLAGGIVAWASVAGAQTTSSNTSATASAAAQDPSTVSHGPGETVLTDGTANKVRAAALAAVPGGTIIRVETDSAGSPYEAHVRKSDGSIVTLKIDENFEVTTTGSGFGAGGSMPSGGTGA